MTEVIDYTAGEVITSTALAPVNPSSEVAVTSYLQQARDWLATAVESTGPQQIAAAKAEIATAAEATKQLGLSKEIQDDAKEMVRRAEYAVRKAVTKAQVAGEVRTVADNSLSPAGDKPSPESFFSSRKEWQDANAMAALDENEFEEVLAEARAEGNQSRANVADKARAKKAPVPTRRSPLPDSVWRATYDLTKKVESLHRLSKDDRWTSNAKQVAERNLNDLLRARDLLEQVINSLPEIEDTP